MPLLATLPRARSHVRAKTNYTIRGHAKGRANIVNVVWRLKSERRPSPFDVLKTRRLSMAVGRSIFFHRDNVSRYKADFNAGYNLDRNWPISCVLLQRNVLSLSLSLGRHSHVPTEAPSVGRNSYYWHREIAGQSLFSGIRRGLSTGCVPGSLDSLSLSLSGMKESWANFERTCCSARGLNRPFFLVSSLFFSCPALFASFVSHIVCLRGQLIRDIRHSCRELLFNLCWCTWRTVGVEVSKHLAEGYQRNDLALSADST